MNPRLLEVMHRQGDVFTTEQAAQVGLSHADLLSLRRLGQIVPVRRNVYTTTALWDAGPVVRHRIEAAAALVNRGWVADGNERLVAGHRTAACLWGFQLPWGVVGQRENEATNLASASTPTSPSGVDLVSRERGRRTYRAGVSVRPADLPDTHIAHRDGVPVTSLARTAVDLMRESSRINAKIIGDQALRLGCAHSELIEVAEHCARWRGGRQALEIARFSDGRAQSGAESIARHLVRERGFGPYVPQYEIRDGKGRKRKLDIAFPEHWTALEPDGKVKYSQPWGNPADVLWEEKLREDSIRDVGWEVVRATWHELTREEDRVVARLLAAFDRAALRRAS